MIKKLSTYAYEHLFRAIDYAFENYVAHQKHELVIFSNLLFFISELVDRHYLERNNNANKAKSSDILVLANTVKKVSQFVQDYAKDRQRYISLKDS